MGSLWSPKTCCSGIIRVYFLERCIWNVILASESSEILSNLWASENYPIASGNGSNSVSVLTSQWGIGPISSDGHSIRLTIKILRACEYIHSSVKLNLSPGFELHLKEYWQIARDKTGVCGHKARFTIINMLLCRAVRI